MQIERQLQGTLTTVFTELIKEKGLAERVLPYPVIEENRADITLKDKNGKVIFFIELKDPTARDGKSVFDSNVLLREVERAQRVDVKYFGCCNFLACAFFDRDKLYEKVSVSEGFFTLPDILKLSSTYIPNKEIENKLRNIAGFYLDRALEILDSKPIKFSEIDELFIFKIRKLIEVYAHPISGKVWELYKSDRAFEKAITQYAQSQLWNKPSTFEEVENLTHIGVLMLISKLIFYKTYVDNQTFHRLYPLQMPNIIASTDDLEKLIWRYFDEFKEVTGNFELLIGERSDVIFKIPFVSEAVIDLVRDILETEEQYNFGKIPFDIVGRIFEELIREDERHKLGQYFTPPHVIDFINAFAIRRSSDKIFDPSCGSGTFLVRAYERKKQLAAEENRGARHEVLLNEIYGNDISNYPVYLSMFNMAIRNPSKPSYPRIANKDFFSITEYVKLKLHNQIGEEEVRVLPKFDAIVGNPPYTRQEDIGAMRGTVSKEKIVSLVKQECGFTPSQRTSIYAHFFYHASTFLKDEGYLAFICQNSWLDTDYGVDMQRYLLRSYEIVAIIDSEVERFFPTASVNTTIVILRKQRDEVKRNNNLVKFIWLTQPLANVIKKYRGVVRLQEFIADVTGNTTNDSFRVTCVPQDMLSQYSKWSVFLRAPKVYFDIMKVGRDKFVSLKKRADVRYGIKTGCNEFFILEDKTAADCNTLLAAAINNYEGYTAVRQLKDNGLKLVLNGYNEAWLIEEDCLKPILASPKDVNTYAITARKVPNKFILASEGKKVLKNERPYLYEYILHGERRGIHRRSTCSSRDIWYNLGQRELPSMSFNYMIGDFGKTFKGKIYASDNFQTIYTKKTNTVWLYLNSTVAWLIQQIIIRTNFGDGVGKIQSYELENFPFPNIDMEDLDIDLGETKSYKEELGTLENLKTVNPERLKLDDAILEAVGFKNKKERDDVLLELYRATCKLIEARLLKAQSMKSVKAQRSKIELIVYVEQLKQMLLEDRYEAKNTIKFARQLEALIVEISSESKLQKKIFNMYWKEKFGKLFDEKEMLNSIQRKLF